MHNGTDKGAVVTLANEQLVPTVSAAVPLNGQAQPKSHVQSGRRRSSGVAVMTSVHEATSENIDQSMLTAINCEVIVTYSWVFRLASRIKVLRCKNRRILRARYVC